MPRGIPTIGSFGSIKDDLMNAPGSEVLGTVNTDVTASGPQPTTSVQGDFDLIEPPPPWELEDTEYEASDARRFADVPDSWALRWINPKVLEQVGWRWWQPVLASDERIKVKVPAMVSPDGNIRRGGPQGGDILAWMYRSWVENRRAKRAEAAADLAKRAVDRQDHLKESFKRGVFGPNITLEEARHPSHTIVEGKSIRD